MTVLASALFAVGCEDGGSVPDASTRDAAPESDGANPSGISCGALTCETTCCLSSGDNAMTACMDVCESPFPLSFGCDGPEECGGNACCGTLANGVACSDLSECSEGEAQYCHASADCPRGECCIPTTSGGVAFHVCADVPGC